MTHVHDLDGCAPTPLAHYLKALGVLRLVAEQADPAARGWWEGERFRLATTLDRAGLESFFLASYAPTPFVAPWNKGSGFYQALDVGLTPIERSSAARLEPFRAGIAATRAFLTELAEADGAVRALKEGVKDRSLSRAERDALRQGEAYRQQLANAERRFKSLKADLIPRISAQWRGPHRDWIDTALVLDDGGTARFPALLGTGGNDGRLDFTNNFMQRLGEVLDLASADAGPRAAAAGWLQGALWGDAVPACLADRAVGQFLPGNAGGANSVNGTSGESLMNPFDFILMMEGTRLFTANAVKRLDARGPSRAAAPFVVASQAAGYASANATDESARGEQWMPLWHQPMTFPECRHLFAEGRAQIDGTPASQPLDMARAASRLGVARGVTNFVRFGYIERNGQSNLAVPLGRFQVTDSPSPLAGCIDDLAAWMSSLQRTAADKDGTARLKTRARQLGDTVFDVLQRPAEPARWQAVLLTLAEVEAVMRTGSGFKAQPVPPLRPEWAVAANDGSASFRLALAFALQAGGFRRDDHRPVDPIRRHWLPLDDRPGRPRFATGGDAMRPRLDARPEVVMQGRAGIDDAIALLSRRLVEAAQGDVRHFPLKPAPGARHRMGDIAAWLDGRVDPDHTLALARGLMALDRGRWAQGRAELELPPAPARTPTYWPEDAWLCIRLAHSPWLLPNGRHVPCDPAILRRLAGGDAGTATQLALRRLAGAGLHAHVRAASVPAHTARLWAAALAFPLSSSAARRITARLDPALAQEHAA